MMSGWDARHDKAQAGCLARDTRRCRMKTSKGCSMDGCDRAHKARGLCAIHYDRARRSGAFATRPARPHHGHTVGGRISPTYSSWRAMLARCCNPRSPGYPYYGEKGVAACRRWCDSFAAFLADLGERPPGTTLDRLDPTKGYFPGNCRWATRTEQTRSRRNTLRIEGVCVAELAERTGIPYQTLYWRLRQG